MRYKKNRPSSNLGSIIQLAILIFGLVIAVLLTDQAQKYLGRASTSPQPKEVKITNLTESSFTVSWLTDKPTTGLVLLKEKLFFDDRTGNYTANSLFPTHQVTLRNLSPLTTYSFIIQSGQEKYTNDGKDYQATTLGLVDTAPAAPVSLYGQITGTDNQPLGNVLIYLTNPLSLTLSTLTDQNGNFILNPANSRTNDLKNYYPPKANEQATLIVVKDSLTAQTKELIFTAGDQNLGVMILTNGNSPLTNSDQQNSLNQEPVLEKLNLIQRIILFFKGLFKI